MQEVGGSIPPGSTNIKDCLLPPRPVDIKIRQDENFVFVNAVVSKEHQQGRSARKLTYPYKNLSKFISINKVFVPIV